jgi:hypothetical protein
VTRETHERKAKTTIANDEEKRREAQTERALDQIARKHAQESWWTEWMSNGKEIVRGRG